MTNLIVFKNNLRFNDNPVFYYGSEDCEIIPIYIYDNINIDKQIGSASKYWLNKALDDLNRKLDGNLQFFIGDSVSIIKDLLIKYSIRKLYIEKPFVPQEIRLFNKIERISNYYNIKVFSFNCSMLWEPNDILKNNGDPYRVFSPFYKRGCLGFQSPDKPVGRPEEIKYANVTNNTKLSSLGLLDENSNWHFKLDKYWDISESGAHNLFHHFIVNSLNQYKNKRDFPHLQKNSRLSPYIRFGMISIHRIWWKLTKLKKDEHIEHFKSELGWREFSYYLLNHFPDIQSENLQTKFNQFEWDNSELNFKAWSKGRTGYPIIDAGMRELWETGFIHNRVRMVVSSFLVKNLLIDWRIGEKWFWDCLVDADYASNVVSWQWVAGTGADAAPYFRIFNPILQGEKFDPEGLYTYKFIPELRKIPLKYLQKPHDTNIESSYVKPIIDYKYSRQRALEVYRNLKNV